MCKAVYAQTNKKQMHNIPTGHYCAHAQTLLIMNYIPTVLYSEGYSALKSFFFGLSTISSDSYVCECFIRALKLRYGVLL